MDDTIIIESLIKGIGFGSLFSLLSFAFFKAWHNL